MKNQNNWNISSFVVCFLLIVFRILLDGTDNIDFNVAVINIISGIYVLFDISADVSKKLKNRIKSNDGIENNRFKDFRNKRFILFILYIAVCVIYCNIYNCLMNDIVSLFLFYISLEIEPIQSSILSYFINKK